MEAFGTFFDCIARVTVDGTPQAARERMLMHLLRLTFPLARQMASVALVLKASKQLQVTPHYPSVAAIRALCNKAASVALRMPLWEDIEADPARYTKLIKSLVLAFVAHHSERHMERAYCMHTLGQLAADVLMRPVAIFRCHYQRVNRTPPAYAITPTTDEVYFTRDNAVLLCCQRDAVSGALIVVLVRSLEAPLDHVLHNDADLRFLRDSEDSLSFEYCPAPMYALYETTGDRVQFMCNFDNEEAVLPRAPDPACFYYLYPAEPECTHLPPLASGTVLEIRDDRNQLVTTITEADMYAYFRLAPDTKRVYARVVKQKT